MPNRGSLKREDCTPLCSHPSCGVRALAKSCARVAEGSVPMSVIVSEVTLTDSVRIEESAGHCSRNALRTSAHSGWESIDANESDRVRRSRRSSASIRTDAGCTDG